MLATVTVEFINSASGRFCCYLPGGERCVIDPSYRRFLFPDRPVVARDGGYIGRFNGRHLDPESHPLDTPGVLIECSPDRGVCYRGIAGGAMQWLRANACGPLSNFAWHTVGGKP
jgi:hypothetical protein